MKQLLAILLLLAMAGCRDVEKNKEINKAYLEGYDAGFENALKGMETVDLGCRLMHTNLTTETKIAICRARFQRR